MPGSSRSCDPMVTESPPGSTILVAGTDGPVPGSKLMMGEPMRMLDEEPGEILVLRDPSRSRIEVHIKGATIDEYRVVRLARREARRLAALILFQAERLEGDRGVRVAAIREAEPKSAGARGRPPALGVLSGAPPSRSRISIPHRVAPRTLTWLWPRTH